MFVILKIEEMLYFQLFFSVKSSLDYQNLFFRVNFYVFFRAQLVSNEIPIPPQNAVKQRDLTREKGIRSDSANGEASGRSEEDVCHARTIFGDDSIRLTAFCCLVLFC
jgi:hypothetical protein